MKSERRHDLETNQLAIQLQDFAQRIKPYVSQILLVIAGLLALAYVGSMWSNASSAVEKNAWDEYTLASYFSDPEMGSMKLLAENEEYAGTTVPEWAYLAWADRQVLLASQTYLTDRDATTKRLEAAQDVYQNLASDSTVPQVQDRARYGKAQVLEMLGKVEDAREAYGRVKGDLAALAKARAKQLESEKVREAAMWLATADLPRRETPSTSGATSGVKPSFEAESPAPMPTNNPLNDTRTLEEILTGSQQTSTETNRYGEEEAEGDTESVSKEGVGAGDAAEGQTATGETNAKDAADSNSEEPTSEAEQ